MGPLNIQTKQKICSQYVSVFFFLYVHLVKMHLVVIFYLDWILQTFTSLLLLFERSITIV